MKIRVKIGDLVEQITQAAITVDNKSKDQPLGKVYLRSLNRLTGVGDEKEPLLYLFSTDHARKTLIKLKVDEVLEEGQTLIEPAKLLGSLLGRDPLMVVEVSVLPDKSKIRVKVGKNVANLGYDGSVDVQAAIVKSLPKKAPVAKIAARTLIEFIRRSSFCIPMEENGQQLFAMGVLYMRGESSTYIAQATDGRIIARHVAKQTETTTYDLPGLLIPFGALDPLQKLLQHHKDADIDLVEGERSAKDELQEIFFQMEGVLFGTVLRTGKFPNVGLTLDQHQPTYELKIKREDLKGTLIRAANFVENMTDKRCVKLSSSEETVLRIEAGDVNLSDLKDEIDVELGKGTFKSVSVSVNIDYLSNVTAVQSGEIVNLGFNSDKNKALVVKDSIDTVDTCYAIMPVRPDNPKKDAPKPASKATTEAAPEVVAELEEINA